MAAAQQGASPALIGTSRFEHTYTTVTRDFIMAYAEVYQAFAGREAPPGIQGLHQATVLAACPGDDASSFLLTAMKKTLQRSEDPDLANGALVELIHGLLAVRLDSLDPLDAQKTTHDRLRAEMAGKEQQVFPTEAHPRILGRVVAEEIPASLSATLILDPAVFNAKMALGVSANATSGEILNAYNVLLDKLEALLELGADKGGLTQRDYDFYFNALMQAYKMLSGTDPVPAKPQPDVVDKGLEPGRRPGMPGASSKPTPGNG